MAQKITQALIYQEIQAIKNDMGELKEYVVGTPTAPGLVGRLDRVEQKEQDKEKRRTKQLGYIWSAIGALFSGAVLKTWMG